MSCDSLLCGKERFYMKKYENFCSALSNMQEIYKYDPPYDTVILTGLVGLFEVCFETVMENDEGDSGISRL